MTSAIDTGLASVWCCNDINNARIIWM